MIVSSRPSFQELANVRLQQSRRACFWATTRLALEGASFMAPLIASASLIGVTVPTGVIAALSLGMLSSSVATILELVQQHEKKPEIRQKRLGFEARYLQSLSDKQAALEALSDEEKHKPLTIRQLGAFVALPDHIIAFQPMQLRYQVYYAQAALLMAGKKIPTKAAQTLLGKCKPISALHMDDVVTMHALRNRLIKARPEKRFCVKGLQHYQAQSAPLSENGKISSTLRLKALLLAPVLPCAGGLAAGAVLSTTPVILLGAVIGGIAAALIAGKERGLPILARLGATEGEVVENWSKELSDSLTRLKPYLTEYSKLKPVNGSFDVHKWQKIPQFQPK